MESSNGCGGAPQLPNPFTPMAFLEPERAFQATVLSYVTVGSASVFAWDILNTLGDDYLLLSRYSIRTPTIAYFISRWATLAYMLTFTIRTTAPIGKCTAVQYASTCMYIVSVSCTTLLFFFRVRAIFNKNALVVAFFAFMWLTVLAGLLTAIPGVVSGNIGPTDYCTIIDVKPYAGAGAIIPLVNDTLVFLAICWKLMGCAHVDRSIKTGVRILAFGDYMPSLSKALLQDGQSYYLAIMTTGFMMTIMQYIKTVPPDYRTLFTTANLTIMNVMASRVFRHTKFGIMKDTELASSRTIHMTMKGGHRASCALASLKFATSTVNPQSHTLERVEVGRGEAEILNTNEIGSDPTRREENMYSRCCTVSGRGLDAVV